MPDLFKNSAIVWMGILPACTVGARSGPGACRGVAEHQPTKHVRRVRARAPRACIQVEGAADKWQPVGCVCACVCVCVCVCVCARTTWTSANLVWVVGCTCVAISYHVRVEPHRGRAGQPVFQAVHRVAAPAAQAQQRHRQHGMGMHHAGGLLFVRCWLGTSLGWRTPSKLLRVCEWTQSVG